MSSSRARGYGGYHGRTPFWKILVGTILAAIILASGGLLFIQRSMSFDTYGQLYLPGQEDASDGDKAIPDLIEGAPEEESPPAEEGDSADAGQSASPSLLEGPEAPWGGLRAYRINASPFSNAIYWDAHAIMKENGYNAAVVTLKDETGAVYFPAQGVVSGAVRIDSGTGDALAELTGSHKYAIARLCCFLDPLTANANVEKFGLKNTGTYIFYDEYAMNWTDPGKLDARAYLYGLAEEIAALGFDEILLTHVGYPTEGKLDKIAYGPTPIGENLSTFLRGMREALDGTGVKLSIEVPKALLYGDPGPSGLTLDILAPWVDRVYAEAEPSDIALLETAVRAAGNAAFVPEIRFLPDPAPDRFMKVAY